jgi:glycosyltransferase involved in cell wall biosynthesis
VREDDAGDPGEHVPVGTAAWGVVSVVIPVHNGERHIREAINSVLRQTHSDVQIIVVDDGSTDESGRVVHSFGSFVHYSYQSQSGASTARNRGVDLADGRWIAFLDADDIWEPDKLRKQLVAFGRHDPVDMVFGHVQQFYSPELPDAIRRTIKIPSDPGPGYHVGTLLMRTTTFRRVGAFLPELKVAEFAEWYMRAKAAGLSSMMLPDVVMRRRVHANNMGRREQHNRRDYVRAIRAGLEERRRRSGRGTPT